MYKFDHYTEKDEQKVLDFMKANPFAIITGAGNEYPVATHIPIEIKVDENGKVFLSGHIMRKTDHHLAFEKNNNVLVIFPGPHCFISASWYTDPKVGSTWDYMTVHAKGKITFTDDEGTLKAVKAVSDKFEGTESAGAYDNLPKEYIDRMVKAIVGFSIEVENLDNVFKLSQNREIESQKNIIAKPKERGDDNSRMIAEEMEQRLV